jgi:hypothetical protein
MSHKISTKIIQRRYPDNDWDFKAVSTMVDGREVIFETLKTKGKKSDGVEIYQGSNYIVGDSRRSYSRRYPLSKTPDKYKDVVSKLIHVHAKTRWSDAKHVDRN